MKILQIIESAYRATLEEQDDAALWLSHALKNNGADITFLLRNNAVNYSVRQNEKAPGLPTLGVEHPPQFSEDLQKVQSKGAKICVWREDLEERGISAKALISGVEIVSADELRKLLDEHDYIFHW